MDKKNEIFQEIVDFEQNPKVYCRIHNTGEAAMLQVFPFPPTPKIKLNKKTDFSVLKLCISGLFHAS
jgi:hypothetical protein